jgi:hypothetical protein
MTDRPIFTDAVPNNHPNSCICIECAEYRRTKHWSEAIESKKEPSDEDMDFCDCPECQARRQAKASKQPPPPPETRTFDVGKFPELGAMLAIHDVLEPRTQSARARVLGAAALLSCPNAFTDEQWLNIIHQAQQP